MQSITLAQIERAIRYWRKHLDHAENGNGVREEQVLINLYRRLMAQRVGAIDIAELIIEERFALAVLLGSPSMDSHESGCHL